MQLLNSQVRKGRQWNRGGRITIILLSMCFLIRTLCYVSNLGLYYQSFFICLFFLFRRRQRWLVCLKRTPLPQMRANSLTTHGEKLRFFFPLTTLFRPWVITSATIMNASISSSFQLRIERMELRLLYFVLWLLWGTRTILFPNQMRYWKQSQVCPWLFFPWLRKFSCCYFETSLDLLMSLWLD